MSKIIDISNPNPNPLSDAQQPATLGLQPLSDDELQVVLRMVGKQLPPVLSALEQGGNGWKQTMTLCSYLLAGVFNRHPEYMPAAFSLLGALESFYPQADAAFAQANPGLASQLIKDDVAFWVIPDQETSQKAVKLT